MLLYGNPKVKKSWLCQYLAFCCSVGIPCFGLATEQSRAMLCNFEISPLAYAWRLKDMSHNFQLVDGWLYESSPMLMYIDEDEAFNQFAAAIRTISPNILFLDCLAACFGGDENDGRDIARFIEKINILKVENNCSIVIVHHTNKNILNNTNTTNMARGHSRLAGWVDSLVYMAEQPTGIQLQIKARQATREVPNINIRFSNYLWEVQ
jgi:RecA-family ATPase